jgi:ATP-dependent DNA helicase RecG
MALPRETERLEFKEAKNQYDSSRLFRYCIAIANEGGGRLILGVSDEKPRRVVGTAAFRDLNEVQSRILDKLRFRVSIDEIAHPNGRVLIFNIPGRPTGTAYHFEGAYLMRCGEDTVPMTEDRLRAIFDEGKPDWLSELAAADLDPADVVRLLDTQSYFDLMKLAYPARRTSVLDRLERDWIVLKQNGSHAITNLGAILFAKRLDDFRDLARKAPRNCLRRRKQAQDTPRTARRQGLRRRLSGADRFYHRSGPDQRDCRASSPAANQNVPGYSGSGTGGKRSGSPGFQRDRDVGGYRTLRRSN